MLEPQPASVHAYSFPEAIIPEEDLGYFNESRYQESHNIIYRDYFAEKPVYAENYFKKRFRMTRETFLDIYHAVINHDPWFTRTREDSGQDEPSSLLKVVAVTRALARKPCFVDVPGAIVRVGIQRFC
jgi:hypothetical protein